MPGSPNGQLIQALARPTVVGQAVVEVGVVGLALQARQQPLDGRGHVAEHAEVDAAAPAQALRPQVHLGDASVGRVELPVREVGAEHQ